MSRRAETEAERGDRPVGRGWRLRTTSAASGGGRGRRDARRRRSGHAARRRRWCRSPARARCDEAVAAARAAQPGWREVPPQRRARAVLALREELLRRREELVALVSADMGKTLADADGEVGRGIESVESAAAIPHLLKGENLEGVAAGVDVEMVRQPVGVVAAITPFNFPAMIPLWFLPYAIACGNTFILKPSEQDPRPAALIIEVGRRGRGDPARRRQPRPRRPRRGQRRSSTTPGSTRSPSSARRRRRGSVAEARRRHRQARAGARRRQELAGGDARRRPRAGDAGDHGLRLRRRRAALPGRLGLRRRRRRGAASGGARGAGRGGRGAARRPRGRPGHRRLPDGLGRGARAGRRGDRRGPRRTAPSCCSTAAATPGRPGTLLGPTIAVAADPSPSWPARSCSARC